MPPRNPADLIRERSIVVCVGTGGVGKTTVAAALALAAARMGRKTLVLTIDPAKRLADAMGIRELGNEPQRVQLREDESEFELYAMMLDTKRTFDAVIARFAPDDASHRRILDNPIYQHVSGALAGSGEYAAMEKVLEMSESGRFDLVVVDTPPAQHLLDFLDAPKRLVEFLDSRLVRLLVHPAVTAGRFGVRLFQRPVQGVLQLVERLTGVGFLEDLAAFLKAIDDMSDGFKQRANRIQKTLLGNDAAFVLVAGPGRESSYNAELFLEHLDEAHASVQGVVINRMHVWPGSQPPPRDLAAGIVARRDLEQLATALGDPAAAEAAAAATSEYAHEALRDYENTRVLCGRAERSGCFFRMVPEQSRDISDLEGLTQIASELLIGSEVAT